MAELSVLIVGSDERWKLRFSEVLSRDGYAIITAGSIQEYCSLLDDPRIGTVIVDAELGVQGVKEVLERAGIAHVHLPVIVAADEDVLTMPCAKRPLLPRITSRSSAVSFFSDTG